MSLDQYYLLGRTGLRVSPLALGTMTFGADGWRAGEETSRALFHRYTEAGGNFIDTANAYSGGRSEELLGTFMRETGTRDHLVVATKFSVPADPHDPNMRGNGRKNVLASLEASLRRLQTSYIDLYWLHMWDIITPVEEVMATLDALVRGGKVRAIGLSNVPAWYAAKAQTLAQARGWEPVAALQLEYALIERTIELEHAPAAAELGIGIIPWSPLGYGFLTGKYTRTDQGLAGSGRLATGGWPDERGHPDQHWHILDAVSSAAKDIGRTPAQAALNWVATRPGVISTLTGATSVRQLEDNLAALDFQLPAGHRARLDELSRPRNHFYSSFTQFNASSVRREPPWYRS